MEFKAFNKSCEGVIFIDKLSDKSKLKQMVEGCLKAFGLCSNGIVVVLDNASNIVCPKVEVIDNKHLCEIDSSPCYLKAVSTNIKGLSMLMSNFPIENFLRQEGIVPDKAAFSKKTSTDPERLKKSVHLPAEVYDDENEGISPFLTKDAAAIKRAKITKSTKKSKSTKRK
ncbi:MAG: hypothetical protein ABUJ92_01440 [Desulfobacterales bacterium]